MTREDIGSILKELRLSSGKTQKEVAEMLGRKQQIVGHWETGYSQPDADTLFTLCEIYGVTVDEAFGFKKKDMIVSKNDMLLIEKYYSLDEYGRESIDIILNREAQRAESLRGLQKQLSVQTKQTPDNKLYLYTYLQKIACAGTGFYFVDIPTDVIEAPYMHGADFIIGVNGDSMEPDFHDGERLYIQKVRELTLGDIGIFTIGNECFVKELGEKGLISKNLDYEEIPGTEDVRLIGRVLGKVED